MKLHTLKALRSAFAVLSVLFCLTGSLYAQAPFKVAAMPSFTQNQTYGNAQIGEPVAVWGRAWGGTAPYTYTLDRGDGTSVSGSTYNAKYIGGDHTYTSSGSKTMTLTVTDSAGATASRSATVRVFLNPDQDTRVNISISRGLVWLYRDAVFYDGNQLAYWGSTSTNHEYRRGANAFAVLAFEENGHKPGNDYEEDIYAELVQAGLSGLLKSGGFRTRHGSGYFHNHAITWGEDPRNMDYLNGNGYGAVLYNSHHATYINGISGLALALATNNADEAKSTIISGGPFDGMSHFELMQDLTEQFSFCQGDYSLRGAWEYAMTRSYANRRDGSSQQWPCLFMKGAMDVHGIEPADWVKEGIDKGFKDLQNSNGGIGYSYTSNWLNSGKAGGAMVGWNVAGKDSDYGAVQKAVSYIGSQYYQAGGWSPQPGWAGYSYAMYGMKKGLALMEVETIDTPQGPRNWYQDMSAWLLGETPDAVHATINPGRRNQSYMFGQVSDGRWRSYEFNIGDAYTTSNAILILTKAITVPLPVAVIDEFADADSVDPEEDGSSDSYDEVKAGANVSVSGGSSFHQGAPDFVINQYLWILRADNGSGSPVGALDWSNPSYTGVNIVLDRDPADAAVEGLLPGVYHLTLRVGDDAEESQFSVSTKVFEAVNKNFPPIAVPIPPGQIAYTGEFVPGNAVQVTLDASHSYDPEGDEIISYAWDLDGDGFFNDPEDQALADDATSPTPTLTFDVASNIEVGLQVCSQDEFGAIKCSSNQARIEVFVTELDLFVSSVSASNIIQGVSADIAIEFGSDLDAPLSGVQVRLYDGLPPIYGGGGVALGSVFSVDFADNGSGAYTAYLGVEGLALNAGTEEVFVFLDSNTAVPEYNEDTISNVVSVNVSNQIPVAVAQDLTLRVGDACTATAVAADFDGGSSDPDGDTLTFSIDSAGPWEPGEYQITLTVSDGKESASDTATLTVVDDTPPVITLTGGDVTLECSIESYLEAGASATDNCEPKVAVVIGGDVVDVTTCGTYVVTYDASDVHGNAAVQVTRTVTVEDTTPPVVVSSPSDLVIECPEAPVFGAPQFTDACDKNLSVTSADESLPVSGKEISKVQRTWTATDKAGLSVSSSQTITVVDTTAPAIEPAAADYVAECDGAGNLDELQLWLDANGGASATDACGDVAWRHDFSSLSDDCGGSGSALVTFTATDGHGNSSSASATFTIVDTTAPDLGFEVAGVEMAGTITMMPNQVPVTVDVVASDICGHVTTEIAVTCHAINGAGKVIDKSGSCEIQVVGNQVIISDAGGVGTIITITAEAEDECGNVTEEVLVIEVINPGKGGQPGGGSDANEGVGNGVDGDTPGHDNNGGNDDPGTSPGNPGAKGKKKR